MHWSQHNTTRHNTTRHSKTQHDITRHSTRTTNTCTATYKVALIALWNEHVHLRGLCRDNVCIQAVGAEVHLAAIGLVDGDGGDLVKHLHLHAPGVDSLKRGHGVLKDDANLLAAVDNDAVHLAIDADGGLFTP